MRRYAIAKYLTPEQRERAARATYARMEISNGCERGDCWHLGETVMAIRDTSRQVCPIGVALGLTDSPDPWQAEAALGPGTRPDISIRRLRACQAYIHAVDSGQIGPDQVAASLGVPT